MSDRVSAVPLLARRFLLSKVSDGFLSFIAWVSVVGVALGVLALVVVTSVINGFESELTRVISGMNGDVVLYSKADPIAEPDRIAEKIRKVVPDVQALTTSFMSELMVSGTSGVAGAILEGLDLETAGLVTEVPRRVIEGRMPQTQSEGETFEVALGSSLSDRIGANVGSVIRLIIPFGGELENIDHAESGGTAPKIVQARVVGVVRMGMYEYDSQYVFSTEKSVQKLMGQPGKVTSFKIKLKPGENTRVVADRLADSFGYPFRAKDWAQLNKNLFYAIRLEKVVISIILAVIVIVAAFNVVSTLMMMIHDKTKEIAILKAMGFRASQGFKLFCLIGVGMGLVGTVFGVSAGMGVNWILAKTHLINLPADIYYIGFLPVVVEWKEVGIISIVAISISFLATLYPAWKVAHRSPLDGLRYE